MPPPLLSPKAQAAADRDAIEKRRRELIDEKQTFDARKVEQYQNELRRQDYRNIDQMQFPQAQPIQYKNTVPAMELSQQPLVQNYGEGVGGPFTPAPPAAPRWSRAPIVKYGQPVSRTQ